MNNSRQSDIPGYLYALDGMRAISLIFIVIFHTFQQSWIFYNLKISPDKYLFNFEIFQRYGYVAIDSFLSHEVCLENVSSEVGRISL